MSNITGGCHCGAIRYQVEGELIVHALCHCSDCRRHAGAPMVGWTMYAEDAVKVTKGQPKIYQSSEHGRRHFCADCGTGLFYTNANILPGIIDIQSGDLRRPRRRSGDGACPGRRTAPLDGARARTADLRPLSAADIAALERAFDDAVSHNVPAPCGRCGSRRNGATSR